MTGSGHKQVCYRDFISFAFAPSPDFAHNLQKEQKCAAIEDIGTDIRRSPDNCKRLFHNSYGITCWATVEDESEWEEKNRVYLLKEISTIDTDPTRESREYFVLYGMRQNTRDTLITTLSVYLCLHLKISTKTAFLSGLDFIRIFRKIRFLLNSEIMPILKMKREIKFLH